MAIPKPAFPVGFSFIAALTFELHAANYYTKQRGSNSFNPYAFAHV